METQVQETAMVTLARETSLAVIVTPAQEMIKEMFALEAVMAVVALGQETAMVATVTLVQEIVIVIILAPIIQVQEKAILAMITLA